MELKKKILDLLRKKKEIKVADLIRLTGFSRAYLNRFLVDLRDEGKIVLIGKAKASRYVLADKNAVRRAKKSILSVTKTLKNISLSEDIVLDELKRETGIFMDLRPNVASIVDYAFTEMLNNAIDHSRSKEIEVKIEKTETDLRFDVIDHGIGIFPNILKKKHLKSEMEAIQELLKGKQTTAPSKHSGEGIFFTSKMADSLVIESSHKKLMFNNIIEDIFVNDIRGLKGTKVIFLISLNSKRKSTEIFAKYTGDSYEFSKTRVAVRLYKMGEKYISRSQARRILGGLEKFKTVVLDFDRVETVGQAFADEVFRVWQNKHPEIEIISQNANENVDFMIKRAI